MKLHPVDNDIGAPELFCGPTVICAITGKPLSEVLAVIKDNREHFARDLERHRCDPALVQLPDLSGLEFVSQLRSRGSQVPTIMITATTDPALERRAAELGIKQVLQKPLSNQVLLRAVREELE